MTFEPAVAVAMGTSALVALAAPFALALVLSRRLGARWSAFAIGALTFFVSQVVLRLPWQVPLGLWLKPWLTEPLAFWGWLGFSALTAALFEELGRFVAFAKLLKQRTPADALMLGAGHGGFESVALVGLSVVGNLVVYVMLSHGANPGIPEPQLALVEAQLSKVTPTLALLAGLERVSAMALHLGCSMLVLQRFVRGGRGWLARAIVLHALANLVGVGITTELGPLAGEAAIAVFGAFAAGVAVVLARAAPPAGRPPWSFG